VWYVVKEILISQELEKKEKKKIRIVECLEVGVGVLVVMMWGWSRPPRR